MPLWQRISLIVINFFLFIERGGLVSLHAHARTQQPYFLSLLIFFLYLFLFFVTFFLFVFFLLEDFQHKLRVVGLEVGVLGGKSLDECIHELGHGG